MASSSNGSNADNLRFESIRCRCGQRASVVVSKTQKKPGRLYYSYSIHGWLKWVAPDYYVEDEVNFDPRIRRAANEKFGGARDTFPGENRDNGIWNGIGNLKLLVAINLILMAAYLFGQIINLLRS